MADDTAGIVPAAAGLRLVINAESLAPPRTGIGTYTAALIAEWRRLLAPGSVQAFFGGRLRAAEEVLEASDAASTPATRRRERVLAMLYRVASMSHWPYRLHQSRNRQSFARACATLPPDSVYHEPNFILKPFAGARVATVHDLSFLHYPEAHPAARVRWLAQHLPETLARADRVITVSDFIRRELLQHFGADPARVTTIPPGVDERFRPTPAADADRVLRGYGLARQRFVLCVSTLEPRKNLHTLMHAWSALPRAVCRDHRLVIAGSRGWHCDDIERQLAKLCEAGEAVRLGYVPKSDLPALFSGCTAFVYPSAYEGFGLPVLEAMACGAPCVVGAETALAEIAGDAVETAPPRNSEALAAVILALLEDDTVREQLGRSGAAFARGFSWRRAAQRHLAVFTEARQRRAG